MQSKGPVDFLLGIFLELGAVIGILLFLGDIPWQHWTIDAPSNPARSSSALQAGPSQQISFRPLVRFPSLGAPSQPLARPPAPALLAADNPAVSYPPAPLATTPPPHLRRDFPRNYRY